MANLSKFSPPPGTRFLPSDVVLVMYYLKRKVVRREFKLKGDIPDIALNNFSPSELREMSYPKTRDLEGFFFCSLGRRYSTGRRKNRSGKGGSWNVTGKDKPIYNRSQEVGLRTTLTFYRGKGRGIRTDWRIHEYRLEDKELPINEFVVLCKIFEKKSRGPKTDEEYESPVEDDADDSVNVDDENDSLVSFLSAIPSSSLGPEEGQNTVATTSAPDFANRQDAVSPPLPTHTGTPIVPRCNLSSPGHVIHNFILDNVSDGDGNTCNGSGSHQVDSVPSKSTVEDLDTYGICKGSEDMSDHRKINSNDNSNLIKQLQGENLWQHHCSPGSSDWFNMLEFKDVLNTAEEDWDAYIRLDDLSIPVAADVSNQGTSYLPAPNATPVLPAHEAMDSSENIWGHREPTCDSAAYAPLKAGEIVGQYAPQSSARVTRKPDQPDIDGKINKEATEMGSTRPHRKKYRGKVVVEDNGSKVSTIFSLLITDNDFLRIASAYHIPPTVLCRRAESDEPACNDSSGEIAIYEEMLEAGLRFPMPSPVCRVLHYFSLTPGRLAPNGWRVLLGFLTLWRRVHQEDASPEEFHAAYSLTESPTSNRGWYYLAPRGCKLLTGLRSNCHSWKSRFFFVGGEWASKTDQVLVLTRWGDARRLNAPVLSESQERKLQAVRDHPEKDLGVLLPKESGGVSGSSQAPPAKRKVDRGMIETLLSSRSGPPSKAARVDNTTRGESSRVSSRVSSLAARIGSPQSATSSATTSYALTAIRESSSPAAPPAPHSCPPRPGAPAGAIQMLGHPGVIRERLGRFVIPHEVSRITSLGTEGVIDSFLKGQAQASTASVSLLSKARQNSELKRENESMRKELSIAQKRIADLEADTGASEATRERASQLETELSLASERAAKAEGELLTACERERRTEAELVETRERASLKETELVEASERASLREAELVQARQMASLREVVVATEIKAACDRASQAEKKLAEGVANAFIDGYEELRGKITAAFPHLDFSVFLPTEEPDDVEDGEEDEEDDKDDKGSHESS